LWGGWKMEITKMNLLTSKALKLYAKREDMFKELGKENYLNWIMGVNTTSMTEFDKKIKELDDEIQQTELELNELEKENE